MSAAPQSFRTRWRDTGLTITWVGNWFASDDGTYAVAHLEIHADNRVPLPVTETGYRSLFIQAFDVEALGGPVAFVLAWLDQEADSPAWRKREIAARQFSLF